MRRTLHLVFVLHQPVGVPDARIAATVDTHYEPLIDLLEAQPEGFACAVHCSGYLLEWLDAHRHALLDRIAELVTDKVVEMIGGGFYAPLLPIIPWRDGMGQIEMSAGYLERRLGERPEGVWLTDGVWEPRMAEMLADAGATYTFVDPRIVADAGVESADFGHFATEHVGRSLVVLPVCRRFGERVQARGPERALKWLRKTMRKLPERATASWAGTPEAFADPAAVGGFLEAIAQAEQWLSLHHPVETAENVRPLGIVYMRPTTCLGRPLAQQHFVRYPEAAWMHKRMIDVSRRFAALERVMRNQGFKGLAKLVRPRRALFRGQAATIYEQGGTIYRPAVRDGVYRNLIACASDTHALIRGDAPFLETSLRDLFGDRETGVLMRNAMLRVAVLPHLGGTIVGFEHSPSHTNLQNVITRRAEPWQPDAVVDGHTRAGLHDRFLPPNPALEDWRDDKGELGDFLHARYALAGIDPTGRGVDERVVMGMSGDGHVRTSAGPIAVNIIKRIGLAASKRNMIVAYDIDFAEPLPHPVWFATEVNWSAMHWLGGVTINAKNSPPLPPTATGRHDATKSVKMVHTGLQISAQIRSETPMTVIHTPITTENPVAHVEGDDPAASTRTVETLQGVAFLLCQPMATGTRQLSWRLRIGVKTIEATATDSGFWSPEVVKRQE